MNLYESTFIINPQSDDATIESNVTAVADIITSNGGKVIKNNQMGTRRLAYPIQGLTQGYYHNLIFEAKPEVLPMMERRFKLEDAYIRHLIIRFDGDPKQLDDDYDANASSAFALGRRDYHGGGGRREGGRGGHGGGHRGYDGPRGGGRREDHRPAPAEAPKEEAQPAEGEKTEE